MANPLETQIDIGIDDTPPKIKLPYNWPRCLEDSGGILYDIVSTVEVGSADGCTIWLDEYADGHRCALIAACSHRFHAPCIEEWLEENYTCPLCRHNLV